MSEIILATLNAKYSHASFALRYLMANLGDLAPRAEMLEFDINQRPVDIVEAILARKPKIVGLGVYIWNVTPATEVVAALKRIRPEVIVILGGPEVSYETETQPIVQLADHVITGEADLKFAEVCRGLLAPVGVQALACPRSGFSAGNVFNVASFKAASLRDNTGFDSSRWGRSNNWSHCSRRFVHRDQTIRCY